MLVELPAARPLTEARLRFAFVLVTMVWRATLRPAALETTRFVLTGFVNPTIALARVTLVEEIDPDA